MTGIGGLGPLGTGPLGSGPLGGTPPTGAAFSIAADPGSYTVTGSDASLEHGWKIAADAGSHAVAGTDATLTYVSVVVVDSPFPGGAGAPTKAEVERYLAYMRRLDREEQERRAKLKAKARELEETIADAYAKAVGKPRLKSALKAIEAPPAFTPESLGVIGHQVAEALSEALEGTGRRFAADRMRLEQLQRSLIEFDGVMQERQAQWDEEEFLLLGAL